MSSASAATFEGSDDVDRPDVRIGVKDGSVYDLFLTRTIEHAEIVRGTDGTDVFVELGLEVAAGIRQPLTAFVGDSTTYVGTCVHADPSGRRRAAGPKL